MSITSPSSTISAPSSVINTTETFWIFTICAVFLSDPASVPLSDACLVWSEPGKKSSICSAFSGIVSAVFSNFIGTFSPGNVCFSRISKCAWELFFTKSNGNLWWFFWTSGADLLEFSGQFGPEVFSSFFASCPKKPALILAWLISSSSDKVGLSLYVGTNIFFLWADCASSGHSCLSSFRPNSTATDVKNR